MKGERKGLEAGGEGRERNLEELKCVQLVLPVEPYLICQAHDHCCVHF